MRKIIDIIFPMYANYRDNRVLQKKFSSMNPGSLLSCIENADAINIKVLKKQYEDTFYIKDKLEDKAKINIIGITIAITLIMSASGVLNTISEKLPTPIVQWPAFVLLTAAVLYLLTAGIIAVKVLFDENIVYTVPLDSFASSETTLRSDYDKYTVLNRTQNLIRNNSVYSSYECIRNALVCLFVILLLATVPIKFHQNISEQNIFDGKYSFTYSSETVSYLTSYDVQSDVEEAIINSVENNSLSNSLDKAIGIIDSESSLFIKFKLTEDGIKVMMIEPYLVQ